MGLLRRSPSLLQCWLLEGNLSSPAHYRLRYAERFGFCVHVCRLLETRNTGDARNLRMNRRLRLLCGCSRLRLTSLLLGFHGSDFRFELLHVPGIARALFRPISRCFLVVQFETANQLLVVPCKLRSLPLSLAHDVVSRLVGHWHL